MPAPENSFKSALAARQQQIGFWLGLADPYAAQISAGAGFDWLLIDAEHAPNDVRSLLAQLQAISSSGAHAVIRPPIGEAWIVKQLLDIGAQTLLIPMVESVEQARELVRATQYPPHGIRGVGAALARASSFNRVPDYLQTANDQICLLVQIESKAGLAALEEITAVVGIDGVFIGPADLAADMGFLGNPGAPEVQEEVEKAIEHIIISGKAAGILTADRNLAKRYLALGATFVAVGTDVTLFARATSDLAASFRDIFDTAATNTSY